MRKITYLFVLMIVLSFFSKTVWTQTQELVEKRTPFSKTFRNPDNSYTTEISLGYLHYLNENNKYEEIDRNIVVSTAEDYDFEVTAGMYHTYFKSDLSADWPIAFETKGGVGTQSKLLGMGYYSKNKKEYTTLAQVQETSAAIIGNKIVYQNVFPDIDVNYLYTDTQLKEEIFFSQAARDNLPDPKDFGYNENNTYLVFITELNIDMPMMNVSANGKKIKKGINEEYEGLDKIKVKDLRGNVKFMFPVDRAFLESARDSHNQEYHTKVWKRMFTENEKRLLFAGVPLRWLNDLPVGTVCLDPPIEIKDAGDDEYFKDTFIWDYMEGGNYNYGKREELYVLCDTNTPVKYRGLIQFNLAGCNIPQNADVTEAMLHLYVDNASYTPANNTVATLIHPIKPNVNWEEGIGQGDMNSPSIDGATWIDRSFGEPWTDEGAENNYETVPVAQRIIKASDFYEYVSFDIKNTVAHWVANPEQNKGFLIRMDEDNVSGNIGVKFLSSESSESTRPKVMITYFEPKAVTYYIRDAAGNVVATYEK